MSYTECDYQRERRICDKAAAYAAATMARRGPRCCYITADEAKHPDYAACDNAMRGRVEYHEIMRDRPERLVAYLSSDCRELTIWTGTPLGRVRMGRPFESNMGDRRYPFRVTIAGAEYSGIGYGGGGMYARLRRVKSPAA